MKYNYRVKYINLSDLHLQDYRQKQLDKAIFDTLVDDFDKVSTFPKDLRETLKKQVKFPSIHEVSKVESSDKSSEKILFKCIDGNTFESVLLKHRDGRRTVCVSTQIGCPMKCRFCATGQMRFIRNLNYQEIVDQVLFFSRELLKKNEKVSNIVFMGMGEPMLNVDQVKKAVEILTSPEQFALSDRRITISSVGIINGLLEFFERFPQVNLAISLHSADQETRKDIMPIAARTTLNELANFITKYVEKTHRRVSLEYSLIKGVNDKDSDIKKISEFISQIGDKNKKLIHINLIPYNEIPNSNYHKSDNLKNFSNKLLREGIQVTIRKSLGQNENAACGMLKSTNENKIQ